GTLPEIVKRERRWFGFEEPVLHVVSLVHILDASGRSRSKKKRVPDSEVSTPSSPFMEATSLRQMARPRPALENVKSPGRWRRRNASNSVAITAGGIPRPVSCTANSRRVRDFGRAVTTTDPSAVNLSAFVVRLSSTRFNAAGYPTRASASGGSNRTVNPFSSAIG